jgi:branched-chain amino acid transport system substrate-binding protein
VSKPVALQSLKSAFGGALAVGASVAIAACGSSSSGGSLGSGGSSGSSHDPVMIGVSAAQTGYLSASVDLPYISGIKLAVAAINKSGGVNGRKLEIAKLLDEQSTPATGVSNVNALINQDHVNAILAGGDSTACGSVESAVTRAQVPMICVARPPLGSPYQFEVSSSVVKMTQAIVAYVKQQGITKVAFLSADNDYGQIIGKVIDGAAASQGIHVVLSTTVSASATDLTATMQKVAAAHPGAVLDSLAGPDHVLEAKGAAAAGLKVPLIEMSDTLSTFKQATAAYPDLAFLAQAPQVYPDVADPALKTATGQFIAQYTASGGNLSGVAGAAYGWDAVHILAAAIQKAGSTSGSKVQSALQALTYQGAVANYEFSGKDHSGQLSGPNPNVIAQYKGGKLVVISKA